MLGAPCIHERVMDVSNLDRGTAASRHLFTRGINVLIGQAECRKAADRRQHCTENEM
jgi:hypothetical protein